MDPRKMSLEQKVQYLLDRQEIRDVIALYGRGQDEHQGNDGNVCEQWDNVFTEDAVLDYHTGGYPSKTATYREIAEWMRGKRGDDGRMNVFTAWQHHMGPSTVTTDGDTATAVTPMWCTHEGKPKPGSQSVWYLYDAVTFRDELIRTPKGWRIKYRRNDIHWIGALPSGVDPSGKDNYQTG